MNGTRVNKLASQRDSTPARDGRVQFVGDDAQLIKAVSDRHAGAIAAFHDRFAPRMIRTLARILGREQDLEDVLHDTFIRALKSLGTLQDPSRLDPWMNAVAVFTARTWLQRRWRRRWLMVLSPDEVAELSPAQASSEPTLVEALRATYLLLDRMGVEDRLVFALRFIEQMELTEVAEACGVSLATVKRRLQRATRRFVAGARGQPALVDWIERGGRWSTT